VDDTQDLAGCRIALDACGGGGELFGDGVGDGEFGGGGGFRDVSCAKFLGATCGRVEA